MSTRRPSLLAALRRSSVLAAFALMVFVLRVGMVTACAPSDLAEDLASANQVSMHAGEADDSSETGNDAENAYGHCLHCGCHFPAAIPEFVAVRVISMPALMLRLPAPAPPSALPRRELRPPIA